MTHHKTLNPKTQILNPKSWTLKPKILHTQMTNQKTDIDVVLQGGEDS